MRILLVAAVAVTALLGVQAAAGASSLHVSGTYAVTSLGEQNCVPGDTPSILRCRTTGFVSQYSGTLTGTSVVDFDEVIDCESGRTYGQGTETFRGSVARIGSGSLTWRIRFESRIDCTTFTLFNFSATSMIFSGTGDLARTRGGIAFTLDDYSGTLSR